MNTIKLTDDELKLLKRIVKAELKRTGYFTDTFGKSTAANCEETQLLMLLGKLDNIILVADKITDDTSILAKRKYGLFGRK